MSVSIQAMRDIYTACKSARQGIWSERLHALQLLAADDLIRWMHEQLLSRSPGMGGVINMPPGGGKTNFAIAAMVATNIDDLRNQFQMGTNKGKQSIVMAPWNFLLDQWYDELLDSNRFGNWIRPEHIGLFDAENSTPRQKAEALQRPIVLVTYGTVRSLLDESEGETKSFRGADGRMVRLEPSNFSLAFFDEAHLDPNAEETSAILKEHFINPRRAGPLSFALSATPIRMGGEFIGRALYGADVAIHETTIKQAIDAGVHPPMIYIPVENYRDRSSPVTVTPRTPGVEYTESQIEAFVKQGGFDRAMLELLDSATHPITKKPLREMKMIIFGAGVEHCILNQQVDQRRIHHRYSKAVPRIYFRMVPDFESYIFVGIITITEK